MGNSFSVIRGEDGDFCVVLGLIEDSEAVEDLDSCLFYDTLSQSGKVIGFEIHVFDETISNQIFAMANVECHCPFPRFYFSERKGTPDDLELFGDISIRSCSRRGIHIAFHDLNIQHPLESALQARMVKDKASGRVPVK